MEDTTAKTPNNRAIVIVLAVVAVLLVAVIAYMAFGSKAADEPAADAGTGTATPSAPAAFDPATATRVPDGETPEAFVAAYFDAIIAGDFQSAFDRLPADKKASYGDVTAFTSQVQSYGMTEYTMGEVTESGEDTVVNAAAVMPGGTFNYIWTFTKDGGSWLVKSRDLGSMQ